MLCRGGAAEKAKLLFQEWDLDISGHVTKDDVDDMAQKIVQVALDLIPQAFAKSGHLLGPVMISAIKAQGYRDKMFEEISFSKLVITSTKEENVEVVNASDFFELLSKLNIIKSNKAHDNL